VLVLGNVALLVAAPGLVDSGFLGWLELPVALRLALHLPFALAVLAGCTVALTVVGWWRTWWTGAALARYAVLGVAGVAVTGQLAVWHLVGWGLT
jgi:hypothetical protein